MKKTSFHKKGVLNKLTALFLCILMIMSVVPSGLYALAATTSSVTKANAVDQPRLELNFNKNWKFHLGDAGGAQAKVFDDSSWGTVQLPHDFSISQDFTNSGTEVESGNLPGGTGWYRKMFTMPAEFAGKEIILNFDGAYNNAYVYVNGQLLCENHYGYNSFSVNITDYIVCNGTTWNFVAVKVVSEEKSSRWYPGSGLTRDVTMTIVNPVHVSLYGTKVTTTNNTTMNAVVTVQNESRSASTVTVINDLLDAGGNTVRSTGSNVTIPALSSVDVDASMSPDNIKKWDIDNPYLYTLRTTVQDSAGNDLDVYDTEFGFRTIEWNVDKGFLLNGTPVKLKGMCMHHDQGALGAAQEYDAIYRQIKILKDMGCNAIRTSHNIPSRIVLEICNRLGMLVMEEFFDGWDSYKNGNTNDFSKYFSVNLEASNKVIGGSSSMTWAQFALTQTVKRDRNDPCVFLWSCANELKFGASNANYMTIAAQIDSWMNDLDTTRLLTQGNNQRVIMNVDEYMDVIGGNYLPETWVALKENGGITKPFVGTEFISTITSRGVYTYSQNYGGGKLSNIDKALYSYDNSFVGWGSSASYGWYYTILNDWLSGEFVWTGFDYIGEPTPWNNEGTGSSAVPNSSYFGVIDTAGFPKDQFYLYRSWWQTKDTTLHLLPGTWNRDNLYLNGDYAYVNVYSNADHIELYLNDTLIGTAQSTTNTTATNKFQYKTWTETVVNSTYCNTNEIYNGTGHDFYAQFGVKYTEGTLSVKAYDANNNEITDTVGTKSVSSGKSAAKIVSKVWGEDNFTADGDSFAYIEFEAVDANGNFVNDYNGTLTVSVNENGKIVGVDNGFQGTTEKFQQSSVLTSPTTATIQMFNGRALAIVRTTETPADVAVTATTSDNLTVEGSTFTSRAEAGDELSDEFEEVILQSDQPYIASQYDKYEMYKAEIEALEPVTANGTYVLYPVTAPTASATATFTNPSGNSVFKSGYDNPAVLFDGVNNVTSPTTSNTMWTGVDQLAGQYYLITLPTAVTMDEITISAPQHRASTCTAVVEISSDGTTWTNVGDYVITNSEATSSVTNKTYTFDETSVTQIRIRLTQNNSGYYWTLSEVAASLNGTAIDLANIPSSSSSGINYVPTGAYIITGAATNNYAKGVLTNNTASYGTNSGFSSDGSTGTPVASSDVWYFERLSNGNYYICYFDSNNVKHYMAFDGSNNGQLLSTTTPTELTVTVNSDGTVKIGSGSQYINYFGQGTNFVSSWNSGTNLTLYKTDGETVTAWDRNEEINIIENGVYVIYNNSGTGVVLSGSTSSSSANKVPHGAATVNYNILETNSSNEYTFTKVEDDSPYTYYIQNSEGKYINFGTSNTSFTFSDTRQALTIAVLDDGRIGIYSGSQFLDNYNNQGVFSSWNGTVAGISGNRKMTLYVKENSNTSSSEQAALYTALNEAATYAPGTYDADTYDALLEAVKNGLSVYNNSASTPDELTAAAQAIREAIAGLTTSIKKFPSRLIKYGYAPNNTSPYSGGGRDFNSQSYAAMEEAIRGNSYLRDQIKTLIDYDGSNGTAWTDDYAEQAYNTVVALYAKIYSLAFTGYDITGGTNLTTENNRNDVKQSAWNYWAKNNTNGATESKDEGASVQGLFSSTLNASGYPTSHTAYDLANGLSYLSGKTGGGITSNQTVTVSVDGSTNKTIELTPLNIISVYVPDFFSGNDVTGSASGSYSKRYWNTDFPFIMTTDELGINTYTYDSSDSKYMFRAKYDDDTHTAQSELIETADWSITTPDTNSGNGFFPFNYQLDDDPSDDVLTGENAIYHFGMTFSTKFYIPEGGRYPGSNEDIVFSFSGDDDVLVYVDGKLVLDNGGLHGARSCSINFTEASVSYQYAMDVTDGQLKSTIENDVYYKYGETNEGISADNQAAIKHLNKALTDGEEHEFSFFYLERGSTDSNCKISFNLQQVSDHITLNDQTLVADFGLPISYDVTLNNTFSPDAQEKGAAVKYIGVTDSISSAVSFAKPDNLTAIPEDEALSVKGTYGDYTANSAGVVTYDIKTTEFSGKDSFYLCAEISDDPTYSSGTVYYAFEKVTFIPATNIYFEEDFCENLSGGITYRDGTVPENYNNTDAQYGIWQTVTDGEKAANQAADLVGDVNANVYGFDPNYENFKAFSNASAKKVTVSTKNNPNKKYSKGEGASWPKVQFTFKGTGFDLISVTDCTTGVFAVDVYEGADTTGKLKKSHIVDTYYGYSYAKLYADENGNPTSTVTDTPLYWTKNNTCTTTKNYYGENGVITTEVYYYDVSGSGYTTTPTYYDDAKNLTKTETDNPAYAYAYAYGWVKDNKSSKDSLYQIPVMRVKGLDYGQYTVVITPMFSTFYGHYEEDSAGIKNYNLYVDGIRIYDPAGSKDNISDSVIDDAYKTDGEAYADYIELRDMLIGAESFVADDTSAQKGVIFIDGIPALNNDIEKYKNAGPNNELYLSSGQAVAFEIWATAVPSDVQFSAKSAKGQATVSIGYGGNTTAKQLTTATEMYYSFNSLLPVGNKLTWTQTTVGGTAYYTTGTIVIANSSTQESILSMVNIKWTFNVNGAEGYFRIPTEPITETVSLMSTRRTLNSAYTAVSAMYSDLSISDEDVNIENTSPVAGEDIVITVETSDDVKTLLIKDSEGNIVEPVSIEEVASQLENEGTKQWKVTLNETEAGTYVYTVTGVNEYGLEGSDPVEFTVTVSQIPDAEEETESFLDKLKGFFERIVEFFKKLLQIFE